MTSVQAPDVSVIVPTYNYASHLKTCLSSILTQKGVLAEVLVVDDGSTDDTPGVLAEFGDRIRVVRQDNAGSCVARNTGLALARGEYIQFLDADDILAPGSLECSVKLLRKGAAGIALADIHSFTRDRWRWLPHPEVQWRTYRRNIDVSLCRLNIAPPGALLYPRQVIDEVGGFDTTLGGCEDYDFLLRAMAKGRKLGVAKGSKVYYRVHSRSMGAAKRRLGGLPYDVLLHQRKSEGFYGEALRGALGTVAGRLAFVEGILITLMSMNAGANPEGHETLVDLLKQQLAGLDAQEVRSALEAGRPLKLEASLYFARISLHSLQQHVVPEFVVEWVTRMEASSISTWRDFALVGQSMPLNSPEKRGLLAAVLRGYLATTRGQD